MISKMQAGSMLPDPQPVCPATPTAQRSHWGSFRVWRLAAGLIAAFALWQGPDAIAAEKPVLTFLRIQPDVRARGMGEAAVGLTEIACPYASNPGAIALRERGTLYAGGGAWLPEFNLDLAYFCAGLSGPISDFVGAALSIRMFSFGEIIRTNEFGYVDQYHSFDLAAGGSLALKLDPNLAVGTTISLLYSKYADQPAIYEFEPTASVTSVAFDFGFLIHDIAPHTTATNDRRANAGDHRNAHGFALGLALQSIGPDITSLDPAHSDPLPRNVAMGISYRPADLDNFGATLTLEVDGSLVDNGTDFMDRLALGMGAEVSLYSVFDGRIGHFMDPESWKGVTTLGFSLGTGQVRFNLSYIPKNDTALSKTTFFSLAVRSSLILPHSGRCGP